MKIILHNCDTFFKKIFFYTKKKIMASALLGTLGTIGSSLIGNLLSKGAETIGDVASKKLDTWKK